MEVAHDLAGQSHDLGFAEQILCQLLQPWVSGEPGEQLGADHGVCRVPCHAVRWQAGKGLTGPDPLLGLGARFEIAGAKHAKVRGSHAEHVAAVQDPA